MSLVYRAHYVDPPALHGFAAHIETLRSEHRATHTEFALDLPAPGFRHELCTTYKARRRRTPRAVRDQLARLDECLTSLGGRVHRAPGFEADDILATLAAELRRCGKPGLVVTCDRDLLSLAHGGIEVLVPARGEGTGMRYDAAAVERRFGVPPPLLGQWLALKGDKVDGMPGVPGLHPRDAARIIRTHGSVDALLAELGSVRPPALQRLLAAHTDRIRLNAKVLVLRDDVPLAGECGQHSARPTPA